MTARTGSVDLQLLGVMVARLEAAVVGVWVVGLLTANAFNGRFSFTPPPIVALLRYCRQRDLAPPSLSTLRARTSSPYPAAVAILTTRAGCASAPGACRQPVYVRTTMHVGLQRVPKQATNSHSSSRAAVPSFVGLDSLRSRGTVVEYFFFVVELRQG